MKLTDEQQIIVEENHKLIYWFLSVKGLEVSEWYDLIAIELCLSVMAHDPDRGELSTYFFKRASNRVIKEHTKSKSIKRTHNGMYDLDNIYESFHGTESNIDDYLDVQAIMEYDVDGILQLKIDGYNQDEIATKLGVSQAYVSNKLRDIRLALLKGATND